MPLQLALVYGEAVTELPQDLYIPPDALEVFLEAFEGPLDLLLYLIRKQNIDILDIPVAEITRQYMGYVELMKAVRLELAAEYLVMAAMLAEIKSRMLLPRSAEAEEEEEDPRAELIRRLQEYERFKKAAEDLDELPRVGRDVLVPAVAAPEARARKLLPELALQELMLVMGEMLRRADLFESHQVTREVLSTRERMSEVLERLKGGAFVPFIQLFTLEEGKLGVVVTFMAILELVKEQMVELVQNEAFGAIHVRLRIAREAEEGETLEEALEDDFSERAAGRSSSCGRSPFPSFRLRSLPWPVKLHARFRYLSLFLAPVSVATMNLSDPHELATLLEGILLAAGKPLSLERLAELFDEAERPEPGQFRDALAILALSCAGRSFELKEVASGYRLQIRERFSPWVGRLWEERPQRYSRALLETLVLIAYRQPITRGEIEEIRGVAVNTQIVKTLMEREWIRIVGYREVPGRPAMLATTKAFLDYFNLKSLDELPPLSALREMEPEPEPPVEVAPAAQPPRDDLDEDAIPASIQALADRAIAEAGESLEEIEGEAGEPEKPREETSFRSLLLELDEMEQGLKTDFDDLLDPPEPSEQGDESAEPAAGPIPVVAEQAVEPAVAEAVAGADPDDEERALAEAMREEREALDADDDWPRR